MPAQPIPEDSLALVLEAAAKRRGWSYVNYRDRDGFEALWGLRPETEQAEPSLAKTFLIDWCGVPYSGPDGPRIAEFTTPLDWALGTVYQALERDPTSFTLPSVIIVDRQSHLHRSSFAVEMSSALVDAFGGHVCVFSACAADGSDPMDLLALLKTGKPASALRNPRQGTLRALRQAWIGYTVQSRDHHDLNNLIGPLAFAAPDDTAPLERRALLRMIRFLCLLDKGESAPTTGWIFDHTPVTYTTPERKSGYQTQEAAQGAASSPALQTRHPNLRLTAERTLSGSWMLMGPPPASKINEFAKEGSVAAILLDDQADQWLGFLHQAFGEAIQIQQESRPDHIIGAAFAALSQGKPFERRILLPGAQSQPEAIDQIIFLDLRLFKDGREEEREFYRALCEKLIERADQFDLFEEAGFFSRSLTGDERKFFEHEEWKAADPLKSAEGLPLPFATAAMRILECKNISWRTVIESSLYSHLVTLLPRIVAQIFYTLPIIVFSSTGRRDLTEFFRNYQNIITSFEKPGLLANFDTTRSGFRVALQSAYHLLHARRTLRSLEETAAYPDSKKPDGVHVELFIDETRPGNKNDQFIVVGGLYAIHHAASYAEAIKNAGDFDDALAEEGCAYYSRGPYLPSIGSGRTKKKGESSIAEIGKALARFPSTRIGCLRLELDRTNQGAANDHSGDDTYREALSRLVEIFLHDLIPLQYCQVDQNNIGVSIYVATRVVPFLDYGKVRHLAFRWGSSLIQGQDQWPPQHGWWPGYPVMLESTGRDSVLPLLADLKSARGAGPNIHRAVGVRLIYDQKPKYNKSGRRTDKYTADVMGPGFAVCRTCQMQLYIWQEVNPTDTGIQMKNPAQVCPKCNDGRSVRPDYPGGLYIADEVISEPWNADGGYADTIPLGDLGFDENLDEGLLRLVDAMRSEDRGDTVRAAIQMMTYFRSDANLGATASTKMRKLMVGKVMSAVSLLDRKSVWQISERFRIGAV